MRNGSRVTLFNSMNRDNCQLHVQEFVKHFLGADLDTQNWTIGRTMLRAGLGIAVMGALVAAGGVYIRGSHQGQKGKKEAKED